MGNFEAIAWLPLCAGASIAGLVMAFLAFRRRGAAAGMRVTAWALLPIAAYLTGALKALWTIGSTVVGFVASLVFNPVVWAGVAVAGLSAVLFVVSGVMRGRKLSAGRKKDRGEQPVGGAAAGPPVPGRAQAAGQVGPAGQAGQPAPAQQRQAQRPAQRQAQPAPAPKASPKKQAAADDDFSDIEELLKRRGIS
jgi:hypothetical protein